MRKLLIMTSVIGEAESAVLVHWCLDNNYDVSVLALDDADVNETIVRVAITRADVVVLAWDKHIADHPLAAIAAAMAEGEHKLRGMWIGDVTPPVPYDQDNGWRWPNWEAIDTTLLFLSRLDEPTPEDDEELAAPQPLEDWSSELAGLDLADAPKTQGDRAIPIPEPVAAPAAAPSPLAGPMGPPRATVLGAAELADKRSQALGAPFAPPGAPPAMPSPAPSARKRVPATGTAMPEGGGILGRFFGGPKTHENGLAGQVATARPAAPPAPAYTPSALPPGDLVDCSVFAPGRIEQHKRFVIQVLLHRKEDLTRAARMASSRDPAANRRHAETLEFPLQRGAEIDLFIECADLSFEGTTAVMTWDGTPQQAAFEAEILGPARAIRPTVHMSVDGLAIGEITFELVVSEARPAPVHSFGLVGVGRDGGHADDLTLVGDTATRYRTAFISYAREDFERVSYFAQGLEQNGIRLFLDVTRAEPGEDWAQKLPAEIDRADVFYLMWSRKAAKSKWVEKEAQHACARAARSGRPRVVPMTLHRGAPPPPRFLEGYEFNSRWLAQREAQKVPMFSDPSAS